MLRGINQSMVNRSIARGGGNCKCVNGGSNSSVNGGKITVEFTIYLVDETSGETTKTVSYMTKDDLLKLRESIYNIYLTENKFTDYECQTSFEQSMYSYNNTILQVNRLTENEGDVSLNMILDFLIQSGASIISVNDIYVNGKLTDDLENVTIAVGGEVLTFIDSNDPVLEGANKQQVSLTLYYRER